MSTYDKIIAVLQEHGPMNAAQLGERVQVEYLGSYLSQMHRAAKLKKAGGRGGTYALPSQKLEGATGAPPQRGKKKSKPKKTKGKSAARKRRAPKPAPAPEGTFLAACTADCRLVIIDGTQPPLIFTGPQTEKIAELVFANFKD